MSSLLQNKKIILASHNPGKIKEFQYLLEPLQIKLVPLDTPEHEAPEETGKTFQENALIKARHAAHQHKDSFVLADDSGLEIEALDNQPGVYTGRWYKKAGGIVQIAKQLETDLQNFPNKKARFVCVLCLYHPNDTYEFFEGYIQGEMVFPPRGDNIPVLLQDLGSSKLHSQSSRTYQYAAAARSIFPAHILNYHSYSFGYDPIFQPLGHEQTFAQMSAEEKQTLSHRAKAVAKLIKAYQV